MTDEQGAHEGRPYVMSIFLGANLVVTLVVAFLRRLRIQPKVPASGARGLTAAAARSSR